MPAVETLSINLGFKAPHFQLQDPINGGLKKLEELKGEKATVVMFICNHCPFVKHIFDQLVQITNDYSDRGVNFIGINSNDVANYPDDSPQKMKELADALKLPFHYLYDETQEVAKAYQAMCTPDFSIFDENLNCVYRGQLDSSRPGNDLPVTGEDIRNFLDGHLAGTPPSSNQKPSIGCSIKWKKGGEPEYFLN